LLELKAHLDALLELSPLELPFDLDDNLVMTARGVLSRTTMSERIYAVIKSEHVGEGQPFTLSTMSGRDGPRVFIRSSGLAINTGVPALFSPAGYQNMYLPSEAKAIGRIQDEAWIFATDANDAALISETTLINAVRLAYLQDYTRQWIESILGLLGAEPSPLKELLVNVSNATRLAPEEVIVEGADDKSLRSRIEDIFRSQTSDSDLVDPAVVDRAFASLHALNDGQEGRATPLDGLISDINNLYVYIDQLSRSSPDQLLSDMQTRAGSALTKVRQTGQRTPAPISQWVLGIVSESDNLIAGDATSHIRAAWSSNVAPFCRQALNGRYPLVVDAQQEVLIQDFGRFFSPGGILDSYFNEYLFPIVDTTARAWRLKSGFENSIRIDNASLRNIQQAKMIQQAFFASGGAMPSVTFELRPVRLDPITTTFMLNLNGQITNYSHGPIFNETFAWPGDRGLSQVSFQFNPTPASGRSGRTEEGPWAWFRMLDASGVSPSSTPETFQARFELEDRWAEYQIRANSAFNPFNLPALRTFRCPDQL
jgi:type VI secretion system protein ImpL